MILGEAEYAGDSGATLDDLFRRAGVRHPHAPALIDPPDAARVTGGAPRHLTFAQADRAISAFAVKLRALGLSTDAVVAIQLANTVESVVALLGVLRARLIAAPLPLLWRKQEMVAALARAGAKAIVTSARIGTNAAAAVAMEVAAELFPIRHICGFGRDLPDGVVPLDEAFAPNAADFFQPPARPGSAGAHVAVVTFDAAGGDGVPVARSHNQLIAGGLAAVRECGLAEDAAMLSAIPLGSFAGIAAGLMPWLLGGGTLMLHHGFDPAAFAEQCRAHNPATVLLPGPALAPLAGAGLLDAPIGTILALWRAPEQLAAATPWQGDAALIDIACFGEAGLLPARRGRDGKPMPIPLGAIAIPRSGPEAAFVLETMRSNVGTLALCGPMVPAVAFPPDAARNPDGAIDTGSPCRIDRDSGTIVLTGPPAGTTTIGGYRFRQRTLDAIVADADPAAVLAALPDALLGQRLAGCTPDPAATVAQLRTRGVNSLIAGAFRPRGSTNAA